MKTDTQAVIHHARDEANITTRILRSGDVELEPPGLRLPLPTLFD